MFGPVYWLKHNLTASIILDEISYIIINNRQKFGDNY